MLLTFLQRLFWMVVILAAQMLVFNHIHLFGYATPLPYVFLLLTFSLGTERWSILLWGFFCGLLADITSLTPGVGAAAMTLTAFVQPPLLALMVPKDAPEHLRPGYATMGFRSYFYYTALLTFLFTFTYFVILSFSFHNPVNLSISFASSWGLTFLLCLVFEGFYMKRHD